MKKTYTLTWLPSYSVGIALIDNQHKELFNLYNDLYSHCVGGSKVEHDYFNKVIQGILDFIKLHFSTEETIMMKTGFPGYYQHKREHESFIMTIMGMIKNYEDQKKMSLAFFTHYLCDWILAHIVVSDRQYYKYLASIAHKKDGALHTSRQDISKAS